MAGTARAQSKLGTAAGVTTMSYSLGPDLGQCCGGRVKLATEVFTAQQQDEVSALAEREAAGSFMLTGRIVAADFVEHFGEERRQLYLFGAGHVGRALVMTLALQPFDIVWVDERPGAFPPVVPGSCRLVQGDAVAALASAPADAFVLVMTHSHALDQALVDAALRRGDLPYVGLIGSATKKARFLSRLKAAGVVNFAPLVCPVGVPEIKSKAPAAIALAVAAELVSRDELLRSRALPLPAEADSAKLVSR